SPKHLALGNAAFYLFTLRARLFIAAVVAFVVGSQHDDGAYQANNSRNQRVTRVTERSVFETAVAHCEDYS
ncbi:MAG: hypothetical protein K0U52_09895, partial [Gammaproteobacteria bacterium]|nr:hypothetical protein [Gammaproteobacteria bacterium]